MKKTLFFLHLYSTSSGYIMEASNLGSRTLAQRFTNFLSIYVTLNQVRFAEFSMHVISIQGQAFLWHQIRCIMGILFLIGQEKEQPEVILELLDVEKNPR